MPLDLVALVPDKDIEQALLGLLDRHRSIGIRPLDGIKVVIHPHRDPGVYSTSNALLDPFVGEAAHAIILLDRAWEGTPIGPVADLEAHVERLCRPRWQTRVRCICIDPEIENWIWSDSPHVHEALGWSSRTELVDWLRSRGMWPDALQKPPDPKAAFEVCTREKMVVPSSSIFRALAGKVSLQRCNDPSFHRLLAVLREWFPPNARPN